MGKDLTVAQVKALKPGLHRVSRSLYVQVAETGGRSWVFRYMLRGSPRSMGLGSCDLVTLAQARDRVIDLRRQVAAGIDPVEERRRKPPTPERHSFAEVAELYIASKTTGSRTPWDTRYERDVRSKLATYAMPILAEMDVAEISTGDCLRVLQPVWARMKSAPLLRGYLEKTLGYAKSMKWRTGENPARWEENLSALLDAPDRSQENFPSCDWREVPEFVRLVRQASDPIAPALLFGILCASRPGEVMGAVWDEFVWERAVWAIPGARMKEGRDHAVPLPEEAQAIVRSLPGTRVEVFTKKGNKPLAENDLRYCLARVMELRLFVDPMTKRSIVPHGFRSTFSTWAADHGYERDMYNIALAHKVGDDVHLKYMRSDMVARRAAMMRHWARHCFGVDQLDNAQGA